MSAGRPRTWLALVILCAATLVAYASSFLVPFQFDDFGRIANNAPLLAGEWVAALKWMGNSRLLPSLTLIADYRLYGTEPLGYHVLNLLVHLLATAGVYVLARVIYRRAVPRPAWPVELEGVFAASAALVFACHPAQVEAVTYIIQRAAAMSAMFYVWSVVCFLVARLDARDGRRDRTRRLYAAAAGLGVCALLSKENAITLPLAWLLAEACFVRRPHLRRIAAYVGGLLIAGAAILVLKGIFSGPSGAEMPSLGTFVRNVILSIASPAGRVQPLSDVARYALTQATVVPQYLLLIVRPWVLSVDHDVVWQTHVSAAVVAGAGLIAAVAIAGVALLRRAPQVGFGMLWWLLTVSVESSLMPLPDAMAERRLYLAMPGVGLVVASGVVAAWRRLPRLTASAAVAILLLLIGLTFSRNLVWQSTLSLWRDAADKAPGKMRPWLNLGVAYHQAGQLDDAVQAYCAALHLAPDDELIRDNLESALEEMGKMEMQGNVVKRNPDGSMIIELPDVSTFCPEQK
ncbi:MAG: hypothetical protein ABI629_01015 [bacterium]